MKISFSPSVTEREKLNAGTEILLKEFPQISQNLEILVNYDEVPQLIVNKTQNQLQITCKEAAHYYRGLNQALHHMKENTYQRRETVYFQRNGFMLDCSRNAVFTVEKVKSHYPHVSKAWNECAHALYRGYL